MKKIDLHIHTVSTRSDSSFSFDLKQLQEYVNNADLAAIAITNHNVFDIHQFRQISESVSIPVFPGIEINLENGHLLLIADNDALSDFESRCSNINRRISNAEDSITAEELKEIFHDLSRYILIPHYDKKPSIDRKTLTELEAYITAGEVASPKKFVYCAKNEEGLVPVYFSDSRIDAEFTEFPSRQTYISCGDITFGAIKGSLRDKAKVSLSPMDGHSSFQVFDDGQELSTGLNVIVGERSSGKTFTLDRINKIFPNVKFIQQFSLLVRSDEQDEANFTKLLSEKHSLLTQEHLEEFRQVVNDVIHIDIEENEKSIANYLESLIKYAEESEKRDSFSKARLFAEEEYQIPDLDGLAKLIRSVQHLIENIEYREIIYRHVSVQGLKALIVELMKEHRRKEEERLKKRWLNDLILDIKNKLQMRTAATTVEELDLYQVAIDNEKIKKFTNIAMMVRREQEIMHKEVQGFKIVAGTSKFSGANELRQLSRSRISFSSAYQSYETPYDYLRNLKAIAGLEESDYFRYFAKVQYQILNKDGYNVSGGERSEFNLLQEITDAQRYDMLLIDEPESSFDNLFLKNEVNEIIKEISNSMPVVVVTHNNTVGVSIKPDYLLCTKKEVVEGIIKYRIYSGFPNDPELVSRDGQTVRNLDVTMGCLEAGKPTYDERRRTYEDLEN
jgi:ABC-type dipeptide/oligopeptide/nickel transport system ATPase component